MHRAVPGNGRCDSGSLRHSIIHSFPLSGLSSTLLRYPPSPVPSLRRTPVTFCIPGLHAHRLACSQSFDACAYTQPLHPIQVRGLIFFLPSCRCARTVWPRNGAVARHSRAPYPGRLDQLSTWKSGVTDRGASWATLSGHLRPALLHLSISLALSLLTCHDLVVQLKGSSSRRFAASLSWSGCRSHTQGVCLFDAVGQRDVASIGEPACVYSHEAPA